MFPILSFGRPTPIMLAGPSYNRQRGRAEGYAAAIRDMERARFRDLEDGKRKSKTKPEPAEDEGAFTKYLNHKQKHEEYHDYFNKPKSKPAEKDARTKYLEHKKKAEQKPEEKDPFTKYMEYKKKHEKYHDYLKAKESEKKAAEAKSDFSKYLGYKQKHDEYRQKLRGGGDDNEWDSKTKYQQYQRAPSVEWDYDQRQLERGPSRHYRGSNGDPYSRYREYQEGVESRPRREMQERRREDGEMVFWDRK